MDWHEVPHALRSLRAARGFSALAILTLGLGIAASTAIFTMVNGVLLRRLPYADGDRVVRLEHASLQGGDVRYSIPEIQDLRRQGRSFDAVVEYHSMAFQLYGHGDPQRVQTGVVSDGFFDVLGVRPLKGRLFRPGEEAVGAPPVVLLSYEYWVNVLGSDPNVVGSTFVMNDKVHTVVGVLPPLPTYPNPNDIWMPAGACPFRSAPAAMASRTARLPTVFARLGPGISLERARAEIGMIDRRMSAEHPEAYPADAQLRSAARPIKDEMTATSKPVLLLLFATAVFLTLAAAANFASLTLARQARRAREFAVREALGSGHWRLYRQLAIESLVLTTAGGMLATLLAASGIGLLRAFATRVTPRAGEIGMDLAVMGFTVATCGIVGLAVAAVPFLKSARGPGMAERLRQGGAGAMGSRAEGRLRRALVVAQVGVAFVLLVGAGLLGRSLLNLEGVNAGIEEAGVVTAWLPANFTKYDTNPLRRAFQDRLLQRLGAIPGARAVAITSNFPLVSSGAATVPFRISGRVPGSAPTSASADFTSVSPGYFATVGIPLLRGRVFTAADRDTVGVPIVISQRLAARYWPGRDPVGSAITVDSGRTWNPVIGVVGDVHQYGLDQDVTDELYVAAAAVPLGGIRVLIRGGPEAQMIRQLRAAIHAVDDHEPVADVRSLEDVRGARLVEPRFRATLVVTFSLLALLLAGAGLAAVVGYAVSQRIPEFAIRMALGANPRHVVGIVSREGLAVVAIGVPGGVGVALVMMHFVRALLFQVQPADAGTYLTVLGTILATTALACVVPARRALAADPAQAMRGG